MKALSGLINHSPGSLIAKSGAFQNFTHLRLVDDFTTVMAFEMPNSTYTSGQTQRQFFV
jgi:hypothetical protein